MSPRTLQRAIAFIVNVDDFGDASAPLTAQGVGAMATKTWKNCGTKWQLECS